MATTFYAAFAPLAFTVLGIWFLIVQTRHREWSASASHRRVASAVSLQLALPGLMSLFSLVNPASSALWRGSFATTAIAGAGGLLALTVSGFRERTSPLVEAGGVGAAALFALMAVVAIAPGTVHDLGLAAKPIQVEAFFLSLILFLGMSVAWLLLFEEAEAGMSSAPGGSGRQGPRT